MTPCALCGRETPGIMMKPIYDDHDAAKVGYYKSILEEAGIPCFIKNDHASSNVFGSLAVPQFNPSLCVVNEKDYDVAVLLLKDYEQPEAEAQDVKPWTCPACNEEVPGDFDMCWNCQAALPTLGS